MEKQNPFKLIGKPTQEVPTELKDKIMGDVNSAKLLMDMANLCTHNYKVAMRSLLKTSKKK